MAILVCDHELINHLSSVRDVVRSITSDLHHKKEISEESYQQLRNLYSGAYELARRELRVPDDEDKSIVVMSQSTESSPQN